MKIKEDYYDLGVKIAVFIKSLSLKHYKIRGMANLLLACTAWRITEFWAEKPKCSGSESVSGRELAALKNE